MKLGRNDLKILDDDGREVPKRPSRLTASERQSAHQTAREAVAARAAKFAALCARHGVEGVLQEAGFGADGAARATAELLTAEAPPTAIVFDSDEMALSGAHVVLESGAEIPGDVAIASYEDSPLARTHRPPISAIGRSAVEYGRVAARRMLEIIAGWGSAGAGEAARGESRAIEPELLVRGSTDPGAEPTSPPISLRG